MHVIATSTSVCKSVVIAQLLVWLVFNKWREWKGLWSDTNWPRPFSHLQPSWKAVSLEILKKSSPGWHNREAHSSLQEIWFLRLVTNSPNETQILDVSSSYNKTQVQIEKRKANKQNSIFVHTVDKNKISTPTKLFACYTYPICNN